MSNKESEIEHCPNCGKGGLVCHESVRNCYVCNNCHFRWIIEEVNL